MDIIIHGNGGGHILVPDYRPITAFEVLDNLSREMWDSWRPFELEDSIVPRSDIYEEKGELVMKAELPGIEKNDLDITLEGDKLTIRAEKKEEIKEGAAHHTRERYYGEYMRSVTLPYPVRQDKILATFDNGVLELRMPKAEEVKVKKIGVKTQLVKAESAKTATSQVRTPKTEKPKRQRKPREQKT